MEKLILSQNIHWKNSYRNLYIRKDLDKIIERQELKQIEAIQGIRRSGKSTIFKLLINHLSKTVNAKEILYVNLDDPFFIPFANDATKFHNIVESAEKLTGQKVKYLFLDEVQSINGWERYVKSAYDMELFKKIFITGSNATFLDGELAKLLTGRYLSTKIYPLSFKEILMINGIESYMDIIEKRAKVLGIVDGMMEYGSFVEVYNSPKQFRRDLIKSYYETILLKDCVSNNAIRDVKSFKELSYYLLSNMTSLYSYSSLAKAIGITDISSKEYLSYLENSFLMQELKQFSYSLKEQNSSKKKIYLKDNGFMLLNFRFSNNFGILFENLVYTELIKAGYEVYFYNKNFECDFIAKRENKTVAIQVCYELNERNRKREFYGLVKLPFGVDEKVLLTYNQVEDASNDIKVVSFWEYFS